MNFLRYLNQNKVNPWAIENWEEDRNEVLSKSKDIALGINSKDDSTR